jgi:hypothetical protein
LPSSQQPGALHYWLVEDAPTNILPVGDRPVPAQAAQKLLVCYFAATLKPMPACKECPMRTDDFRPSENTWKMIGKRMAPRFAYLYDWSQLAALARSSLVSLSSDTGSDRNSAGFVASGFKVGPEFSVSLLAGTFV